MTAADAPPRRTALGRWLSRRTLRGRLIAGLLALLAVACAAVGIVTYVVLRHTLLNQLDLQLQAARGRYAACMEQNGDLEPNPPPEADPLTCNSRLGAGTLGARIKNGAVTNQGVIGHNYRLSAADKATLTRLPADGRCYTKDLPSIHGDYRLTSIRGHDGDVLITGLPLTDMESTLRQVEMAEVAAFSAVLVLTGLLGTGLVRWSLRPLRRVAVTAARVARLPLASGEVVLADRVPDANPRTEVGQVGLAFNQMLGHVEAALGRRAASEARLRRFAADASHELRTPLAAIRGYAELALRHPGPVPADIGHALRRVQAESARMSVLVDELLLLAQLDAGRPLARDAVDVTRLAIDATSDARAAAPGHRWLLDLPSEPVFVRGDEHRLRQVLANLHSNAAKHTPPGTTITTTLTTTGPDSGGPDSGGAGAAASPDGTASAAGGNGGAGRVTLTVTDDGPGIPPDLQPTLFERFVRGDTARTHHATGATSTGLGLAIADAVTTAHGGTITVTSHPGHTQFTITLPYHSTPTTEPGTSLGGTEAVQRHGHRADTGAEGKDP